MSYVTREIALASLKKMTDFHGELTDLYNSHEMDLLQDLGRRNILMSSLQEKCFAKELSKKFPKAVSDGKSGQPDIIIPELEKELECKLTSRHRSGSWGFHTDYATLKAKSSLDYLYVLASADFESFAVLHFEGLTVDEFRPVSPGSRGKVAMYKHRGMPRCNVLVGEAKDMSSEQLEKIRTRLAANPTPAKKRKLLASKLYWEEQPTKYSFVLEKIH
ncbi:MAG TPA: hypothetical protein EYG51_16755 [Pseudomonadales bacterium]|nr:hypothetical protein [Pseudomonadales bacterium]